MILRAFVISFLILLWVAQASGMVVEFSETAVVDGISVTLGDIATFDEDSDLSRALSSQVIARAPSPGQEIILNTEPIIRHINNSVGYGFNVQWSGPRSVKVGRNVVKVDSAQILKIIDTYLQENRDRLPDAEIRFIPSAAPLPFLLPYGEVSWDVIPSNPGIAKSSRFSIIFKVDGRVRKNMSVRGRVEMLAPVVIASTDLAKDSILTAENTTTAIKNLTPLHTPCLDPRQVIGKKIKRSIRQGSVVQLSQVEFPPMVRKGELVRMIFENDSLFLTATGVARMDGKQDQTIRVQNLSSRKIIYCRVTAPGIVEVAL